VATYLRDDDGVFRAHGVQLLTISAGGIRRITAFRDVDLFATFGLPLVHDGTDS
jgi:RNA polymerase sigma-70 factor (ECF subfamily)